jgi:hypothetical protein
VELVVVPWAPGPLIRIEWSGPAPADLQRPSGLPIDLSDADVVALVGAYEAVLADAPPDGPTITAAHFALLETASLLRWAPPAGPAEREYVRRHTRAITGLAGTLDVDQLAYLRQAMDNSRPKPGRRPGG